jgi:phosphatidylinositol glycan class M
VVMLLGVLQLLMALGPVRANAGAGPSGGGGGGGRGGGGLAAFARGVLRDLPASCRAVGPAALLYGLAVHFRIYPIIYAPSTVLFLARRRACAAEVADGGGGGGGGAGGGGAQQQRQGRTGGGSGGGSGRSPARTARRAAPPPRRLTALSSSSFLHGLLTDGAAFGLVSGGAFFALGLAFCALYGRRFVDEAFLHHLGRLDPRHNFSAHFYPIYLRHFGGLPLPEATASSWTAVIDPARWAGLPQAAALLCAAAALHAHLPLAWLVSTVAFVALNKVSTAQYFVWYFCLLPAALPHLLRWESRSSSSGRSKANRAAAAAADDEAAAAAAAASAGAPPLTPRVPRPLLVAAAAWVLLQLHWLAWGYAVEFAGRGAFLGLWAASVAFLGANAALAAALVCCYRPPARCSFVALSLASCPADREIDMT